jgi:hypothetical protein
LSLTLARQLSEILWNADHVVGGLAAAEPLQLRLHCNTNKITNVEKAIDADRAWFAANPDEDEYNPRVLSGRVRRCRVARDSTRLSRCDPALSPAHGGYGLAI